MNREIEIIHLPGLTPYADALQMQNERRQAVEEGRLGNALFLLEHRPVITLGRSAHTENILRTPEELAQLGVDLVETTRGGDVTYHGPGQLVAYPILNLNSWTPAIRWYLRCLEQVLINQLARYGLEAGRVEGYTGVWVDGAKVAAIGVGIHNWVTFHGIALNVEPQMAHFGLIIPCGISDKPVTSLRALLASPPSVAQAANDFAEEFVTFFTSVEVAPRTDEHHLGERAVDQK